MASNADNNHNANFVTFCCNDSNFSESDGDHCADNDEGIFISTAEINSWDLHSILAHRTVKIRAERDRIIEHSSYFRGLLSGGFSESCVDSLSVYWNMESFLSVLRFMFGCSVDVTSDNFVLLYEAALFFGVEMLLLKCQIWLREVTSITELWPPKLRLDSLIIIWKYGLEHANDLIPQLCTRYLSRNFMWAMSNDSFTDVPYQLVYSCIQHPCLTIDSEKHLCEAILIWLAANSQHSGYSSTNGDCCIGLLKQIRINLLPLWFAAGKRRCFFFSKFAEESIDTILRLVGRPPTGLINTDGDVDLEILRVRLTEYTEKVDLSGCPQIRSILLLSLLPSAYNDDVVLKTKVKESLVSLQHLSRDKSLISWHQLPLLTFEAVQEVDISYCPLLNLEDAVHWFSKSFPSLRKLRAAHFIDFDTKWLHHLVEKCPSLCDIDLTVDISPVVPSKVSIVSSRPVFAPLRPTLSSNVYNSHWATSLSSMARPQLSHITRLTLEGRTDVSDSGLRNIAELCASLSYLNLKGCLSVTDVGISVVIVKCIMLHSILASDTSFGQESVLALCSNVPNFDGLAVSRAEKPFRSLACKLCTLDIGGCMGVSEASLSELMPLTYLLKHLCLRETQLVGDAFYHFQGSSLEKLDVSETKVSGPALAHLVRQNPGLKCLIARGCRCLSQDQSKIDDKELSYASMQLYTELGKSCKLEEISIGWGFSLFFMETLKPAIRSLKTMVVGLGGSWGQYGLQLLPSFCPLLETLEIYFQELSDSFVINAVKTLTHLQVLALCYCFGEITPLSLNFSMPSLRKLKLQRVAAWMTNADLLILTDNCPNLVELSLLGCRLLNSESQDLISHGWPGLMSIHLEDCGEVTTNGVSSLMNCQALEDLLLRHTGPGIPRNFIAQAALTLPMLRKISLDICDAKDGDFDIPNESSTFCLASGQNMFIIDFLNEMKWCSFSYSCLESSKVFVDSYFEVCPGLCTKFHGFASVS